MSVKTTLARQAVKATAKHTARGTAAKFTHKPFRSITLLAIGAALGGLVGWLLGRSRGGESFEPVTPTGPTGVVAGPTTQTTDDPTEQASETGASK